MSFFFRKTVFFNNRKFFFSFSCVYKINNREGKKKKRYNVFFSKSFSINVVLVDHQESFSVYQAKKKAWNGWPSWMHHGDYDVQDHTKQR
jgi:hypothetical protein